MDVEGTPSKRAMSARQQAEVIAGLSDPFARRSLRVAYHIRRHSVIYVVGALGAIAVGLLPTVGDNTASLASGGGTSTGGAYGAAPTPGASGPTGVTAAVPSAGPAGSVPSPPNRRL